MKIFIQKTLIFLSLPLLSIVVLILLLNFLNFREASSKYLNKDVTTVFMGDSHIETAFDDKLLQGSVNLAQSSESWYFTYYRLKILLENNPAVRHVYLGFSYHNTSSYFDMFIDGEFSNAVSARYFFLLPVQEKLKLLQANRDNFFSYLKAIIKNDIRNLLSVKKSYQGGFKNAFVNTRASEKSIEKRVLFQYYKEGKQLGFSEKNIEYLLKIRDLCKAYNVKLTLINTPLHPLYKKLVPPEFKERYTQLSDSPGVEVIDMSDFLKEDTYFIPDGDHVSRSGAKLTSTKTFFK